MYIKKLEANSYLVILAGFFASFDFVWSMGASGIFKSLLGSGYVLMQGQSLLLVGILIILAKIGIRGTRGFLLSCFAFISIGLYESLVASFIGSDGLYGFQQLIFGFVFPVLLICFITRTNNQLLFFRSYFVGYIVYLCVAIFCLLFFDGTLSNIGQGGWGGTVISMRYHSEGSWFFLILGNANKQSNYLIMNLLLGPCLLKLAPQYNRPYAIFVVLSIFVLLLLCSRAALLLLPIALFLNRVYYMPSSRAAKVFLWVCFALVLSHFIQEISVVLQYVFYSTYIDNTSEGFLGTFNARFYQWDNLKSIFNEPGVFIHGIGLGNYGLMLGGDQYLGTHNLFLDHAVASGLYGPLVLVAVIGVGLIKSFFLSDKRLLVAYIFFVCLACREYSFAYLYVSSMGGLIFIFMLYLTFENSANVRLAYRKWNEAVTLFPLKRAS